MHSCVDHQHPLLVPLQHTALPRLARYVLASHNRQPAPMINTMKDSYESIDRLLPEEALNVQHSNVDAFVQLTRQPALQSVFQALLIHILLLMLSNVFRSENAAVRCLTD